MITHRLPSSDYHHDTYISIDWPSLIVLAAIPLAIIGAVVYVAVSLYRNRRRK